MYGLLPLVVLSVFGITCGAADCDCGYFEPSTGNVFTEYLVVYFNETFSVPNETFAVQNYENKWEKAWNAVYRTGANETNVAITASPRTTQYPLNTSLALTVDPSTPHHLVIGGSLRTLRADIQYGSFRTLIRPAQYSTGGSAMSMFLQYNDTQNIQMSSLNMNDPDDAWFSMLSGDEFPDRIYGLNFTAITNGTNTRLYDGILPWDYTELRVDWNMQNISYYIGNVLSRVVTLDEKGRKKFPSTPTAMYLKHWSDGNKYYSGGPPRLATTGHIGYTRSFFNSSLMTENQHEEFDARCRLADACSMDDFTIRGYSPFTANATIPYRIQSPPSSVRKFALIVVSTSVTFTFILACNIMYQIWPSEASKEPKERKNCFCNGLLPQLTSSKYSLKAVNLVSGATTPSIPSIPSRNTQSSVEVSMRTKSTATLSASSLGVSATLTSQPSPRIRTISKFSTVILDGKRAKNSTLMPENELHPIYRAAQTVPPIIPNLALKPDILPKPDIPLKPRRRIDFLAGLISIVTILVTLEHFMFTFVPAVSMPGAPYHYKSEVWADKIIGTFIFNQIYLGVFFITSTRFLISKFMKSGDLGAIAEKVTCRVFRVLVPIAASAMLQYFLIDSGATKWLQYLPSITWSTWPYTVPYNDFSAYVSELIELVYLIPNGAPAIIFNYCTGVLWTIPVQIQGSWISLLGCVLIFEIKNPWKRTAYYTFCIVNHWYAQSWGAFFWCGVLLTDLDITFKYKKYFQSHPRVFYALLSLATFLALGGLIQDGITRWTGFSLPVIENGIHPDVETGLSIEQAGRGGYPMYVTPRLNGLLFALGLQFIAENSHWAQLFLSAKPFLLIFPHIFTIYLFHGLIFWTIGSMICTHLSALGLPYWANILIVGITCYGSLFVSLPFITPIVETLGKDVTANIWAYAHTQTPPKKGSLWPYTKDLLFSQTRRQGSDFLAENISHSVETGDHAVRTSQVGAHMIRRHG